MTQEKLRLVLTLESDVDTDNPFDQDDYWSLHTFLSNNVNRVKDGWELTDELDKPEPGKNCWPVSCYRHADERWFLAKDNLIECRWDTTKNAGVLVYRGAEPLENPEESARIMIREYDRWANGDCYWYRIEREVASGEMRRPHDCSSCQCPMVPVQPELEEESSCGGLIGWDYARETVRDEIRAMQARGDLSPEQYQIELNIESELAYLKQELVDDIKALGYSIAGISN